MEVSATTQDAEANMRLAPAECPALLRVLAQNQIEPSINQQVFSTRLIYPNRLYLSAPSVLLAQE